MGKSTKTYEERIQEKDLRIEKLAQELKRCNNLQFKYYMFSQTEILIISS